jgi:hypothetical protein
VPLRRDTITGIGDGDPASWVEAGRRRRAHATLSFDEGKGAPVRKATRGRS